MKLVSVVVITFNSEKTIIETLNSILTQTYPKIELIVSDDCSSDETVDIVKLWMRKNRARFEQCRLTVAKKNHGLVYNGNHGISYVKGEYFQIIAGDDCLHSDAIEWRLNKALEKDADVIYTRINVFGNDIKRVHDVKRYVERCYQFSQKGREDQKNEIVRQNRFAAPCGGFYKKEFFDQFGKYDTRFPMMEDYPFIYKYIMQENAICIEDYETVDYRVSTGSLSNSVNRNMQYQKSICGFFFRVRLWELLRRREYKAIKKQIKQYIDEWFL